MGQAKIPSGRGFQALGPTLLGHSQRENVLMGASGKGNITLGAHRIPIVGGCEYDGQG